jgi:hypothetical protein
LNLALVVGSAAHFETDGLIHDVYDRVAHGSVGIDIEDCNFKAGLSKGQTGKEKGQERKLE